MTEPHDATVDAIDAGQVDRLLATKLHVPGAQAGFIRRARLVQQLEGGMARALILVCAPPGFGKTALVADWSRRSERSVAWLSLDAGDNDPARFWRHAAAALDRVRPGIAERVAPLLGPPAPPSFDALAAALINDLVASSNEDHVVLVLDDYHLIGSQPVHASLTFLVEHLPPDVHVVITSRADPPLPLARLRAGGQLAELRAADLRFTPEESVALLREALGPEVTLPEAALGALGDRTEGWAAGLQLAALALRGRTDIAAFVASFSGTHRFVLDYLTEEVLEQQTPPMRSFLLETSVLENLSGALCDAVTGRGDGQAILEAIERANLFLVPLDEVRGWWRYHHLFADLLGARLQQEQPDRLPELHRRASGWYEDQRLPDDAVRHALAAGDTTRAARLIERHADALFFRSQEATLQRWLAGLPAGVVATRPRLLLAQAVPALLGGDLEAVAETLDAAERASTAAEDEPFEPSGGRATSLLANIPATIAIERATLAQFRGDAERTLAFGRQAMSEIGDAEPMLDTIARMSLGTGEWLRGRLADAEAIFEHLIGRLLATDQPTVATWASFQLGRVQRAQGRLDAALETYARALDLTAQPGCPPLPAAGLPHVGIAEVAYQRADLQAALHHAAEGIALCRQIADPKPLAIGLATLGWIRHAQGDARAAHEAMADAAHVAPGAEVVNLLNPVPTQRARLALAQGRIAEVERWVEERGLGADEIPSYPREGEYLVLARLLLATDRPDLAMGVLDRLHAGALADARIGSIIEIQALRALARAEGDADDAALAALADAVRLAQPEGWLRVFADEGPRMRALLGRLVAARGTDRGLTDGVPDAFVDRLVWAIEPAPTRTTIPGLVEAPSERELEVLQLVAAGRTNREVADALFVTQDTVKKHITHILGKLGAANRTEAAARARELGLLRDGPSSR
jgi:LuxR family maltose regulon positive regulatory protein